MGYWLQLDAPDIVADAIRKFLDEIRSVPAEKTDAARLLTEIVLLTFRLIGRVETTDVPA